MYKNQQEKVTNKTNNNKIKNKTWNQTNREKKKRQTQITYTRNYMYIGHLKCSNVHKDLIRINRIKVLGELSK